MMLLGMSGCWSQVVLAVLHTPQHNSRHHHHGGDVEGTLNDEVSLHYTSTDECMNFSFGPKEAGDFPKRLAEICIKNMSVSFPLLQRTISIDCVLCLYLCPWVLQEGVLSRALDVGCGPGGVSFELARGFSEVVGLDYSQGFIAKCQELKMTGQTTYWLPTEASLREQKVACVDASIVSQRMVCGIFDCLPAG